MLKVAPLPVVPLVALAVVTLLRLPDAGARAEKEAPPAS